MTEGEKTYYEKNSRAEFAMKDVFMKPDVVPSASRYINDLRNYQLTTFAEIITGRRDLDYYDTFLAEWNKRGGEQFTKDANDFYKEVDKVIYEQIGR